MEMRVTGKRLGGASVRTAVKQEAPAGKPASGGKAQQDRLELSRQAARYLAEQASRMAEQIAQIGRPDEEGQQSGGSSMWDSFQEELDVMDKCNRISSSISSGDRVPPEDLRYLKKHDIHAYLLALATRKPKEDPKDKESVLSEEDLAQEEEASSVRAAPVSMDSGSVE